MRVIEYTPELFGTLHGIANHLGARCSLAHRPFVDYYYASGDWCKLFLLLAEEGGAIATIGLEKMPFQNDSHTITVGCGSNFHSLRAGLGSYLFLYWRRFSSVGLVFGGSEDTHAILRRQHWRFYPGVRNYVLNKPYLPRQGETTWRVAAKWLLRHSGGYQRIADRAARIAAEMPGGLSVREERDYTPDLLPRRSPFRFRFAPPLDYLRWRYNTSLSFVRYRLFRILEKDRTVGYVVLNDSPARILVAHCDGDDVDTLAYGVLLSIVQASHEDSAARPVFLVSSHPRMQWIYERFGFKRNGPDQPFALGCFGRNGQVDSDTSNWHVSLDWGDNGLLGPFLDQ
ncbi:MAG: hypothetical protein DMD33_16960 [Gemmatimonadetes bacterium]|nr:MAG: hypothetical protein DMD33_16960 [Gemmatimonadota bacterium]PYO74005.1 MAG: hypothetical protein DMD67_14410 [Gemmatimonadota bacterium]TLY49554.1 MAG: hypothetical protein E6K55_12770 [Gemmatimonadota bacterium]